MAYKYASEIVRDRNAITKVIYLNPKMDGYPFQMGFMQITFDNITEHLWSECMNLFVHFFSKMVSGPFWMSNNNFLI